MRPRTVALAVLLTAAPLVVPPAAQASPDRVLRALGDTPPKAAAIYDVREGRFLGSYRGTRPLAPASLLKMVTALVVSDRLEPDDDVTISRRAATADADRVVWTEGAHFTVEEVLHGMMLESSNGAAYALAERAAGSRARFDRLARAKLAAIGATRTVLVDPSGLDAPKQRSTARDLALISAAVLADPWLARIVATDSFTLPWPGAGTATFRNANRYRLLDHSAIGVKNGYTSQAGNTVAAAAERGGRTHVVVALGGPDPYAAAARLMDLAFDLAPGTPEPLAPDEAATGDVAGDEAAPAREARRAPSVLAGPADATPGLAEAADSPTLLRFTVGVAFAIFAVRAGRASRERARRRSVRRARTMQLAAQAAALRAQAPEQERDDVSVARPPTRPRPARTRSA